MRPFGRCRRSGPVQTDVVPGDDVLARAAGQVEAVSTPLPEMTFRDAGVVPPMWRVGVRQQDAVQPVRLARSCRSHRCR